LLSPHKIVGDENNHDDDDNNNNLAGIAIPTKQEWDRIRKVHDALFEETESNGAYCELDIDGLLADKDFVREVFYTMPAGPTQEGSSKQKNDKKTKKSKERTRNKMNDDEAEEDEAEENDDDDDEDDGGDEN